MAGPVPTIYRASRAFLVRSRDEGETDRRITLFTEAHGVVTATAKAAHRSRRRFGGILQKYLLLEASWTERGGRPPFLAAASVVESFWDVTDDLDRVVHADHVLEIAAALFPQPGPKVRAFAVLLYAFRALSAGERPEAAARKAEAAFLAIGGWGPRLSSCRSCGRTGGGGLFAAAEGGWSCDRCPGRGGVLLSAGAIRSWRALQAASPGALGRVRLQDGILKELRFVIPEYVMRCLGKPTRSLPLAAPEGIL